VHSLPKAAIKYYQDGYNCTQSLLLAYGLESGLDLNQMVAAAEPFGVGMARLGETCGAVVGALMIIGLQNGRRNIEDVPATEVTYDLAQEFISQFTARNRSTVCRELLGYDIRTGDGMAAAEAIGAFAKCPKFVHDSAHIVARFKSTLPEMTATVVAT
jgi:C_GCAxxG_C_C family probable redox protein